MLAVAPHPEQPKQEAVTLTRQGLASLLGRSIPAIDRDLNAGGLPRGFYIGKRRYWLREDILAWLRAGAPPADEWDARKGAGHAPSQ